LIPKYMDLSSRYPGVLLIPGTFLVDLGNNRVINRAVVFKDGDIYHQYDKDIPFTYVDVPPGKKFTSLEWEPTFDYEGKRFAIQICADNICPDTNYPKADILVFLSAPQSLFPEQREQYPIILHADGYEDFRVVQPGL
jgi:predicted amidohydrolase